MYVKSLVEDGPAARSGMIMVTSRGSHSLTNNLNQLRSGFPRTGFPPLGKP